MKKLLSGAVALCILAFTACKKHDHTDPATVNATISSPTPGQVFRVGDTIKIQATVQYDGELHGYRVVAADSATGAERWNSGTQHSHSGQLDVNQQWIPAAEAVGAVKIAILVAVDHDGTEARKEVSIRVQP